jgi:hypothetical protein
MERNAKKRIGHITAKIDPFTDAWGIVGTGT